MNAYSACCCLGSGCTHTHTYTLIGSVNSPLSLRAGCVSIFCPQPAMLCYGYLTQHRHIHVFPVGISGLMGPAGTCATVARSRWMTKRCWLAPMRLLANRCNAQCVSSRNWRMCRNSTATIMPDYRWSSRCCSETSDDHC